MLCHIIWVGSVLWFCFGSFSHFHSLGHSWRDKRVNLFAFGQALLSTRKFNVNSSSTRGLPGRLHIFGLRLHELTWVHTVPGAMQVTGWINIVFIFRFRFGIIFQGFCGLVWPFSIQQGLLMACSGLLVFFCGGMNRYPFYWVFPRPSWDAHRIPQFQWGSFRPSQTPVRADASITRLGVKILRVPEYNLWESLYSIQAVGGLWDSPPYRLNNIWTPKYWLPRD